jgi:hypothetical protein
VPRRALGLTDCRLSLIDRTGRTAIDHEQPSLTEVSVVVEHVKIRAGTAATEALSVGEELLLSLFLIVVPIGDDDHRARIKAVVFNTFAAIPALKPQPAQLI